MFAFFIFYFNILDFFLFLPVAHACAGVCVSVALCMHIDHSRDETIESWNKFLVK